MSNKSTDSIYTQKSQAGKGDKPRSVGKKYWENFDEIDWGKKKDEEKETK